MGLCTAAGEATLRLLGEKTKTLAASFFPTKEAEKLTDRRSKSVTTDCDAALHPRVSSHVFNSQKKKKNNPKATACGAGAERKRRTQCSKTLLLKSWRRNSFFLSQTLGMRKLPAATTFVCEHVAVVESFSCHAGLRAALHSPLPLLPLRLSGTSAQLLLNHNCTGMLRWRRCSAGDRSQSRSCGTGASMEVVDVQHGP